MTLAWLIEDFERDICLLADEVKRQGMECKVIRYEPFESGTIDCYPTDYKKELPDGVRNLALEICSGDFQPDPMYVLDICDTPDRGLRLLEAGAFSVAGLYHCDLEAIVSTAARLTKGASP